MTQELPLFYCIRLLRLEGPNHAAQAGWSLDFDKIDKALDFLNIESYVRIQFINTNWIGGSHNDQNNIHTIKISQLQDIDIANEVLWHELIHAKQAEDYSREFYTDLSEFSKLYHAATDAAGRSYRRNVYELEANVLAAKYSKVMLLEPS